MFTCFFINCLFTGMNCTCNDSTNSIRNPMQQKNSVLQWIRNENCLLVISLEVFAYFFILFLMILNINDFLLFVTFRVHSHWLSKPGTTLTNRTHDHRVSFCQFFCYCMFLVWVNWFRGIFFFVNNVNWSHWTDDYP